MSLARPVEQLWQEFSSSGDDRARDALVAHYAPLVTGVAAGLRSGLPSSVDRADLVADGFVGLLDAIDKFEPERGLAFQTYATVRIRGAIRDGLRATDWVPRSVRDKIRALDVAVTALEGRLRRSPSREEVATELSLTPRELDTVHATIRYTNLLSLEAAETEAEDAVPPPPPNCDDYPEGFIAGVRELPEREQIVVALYYWERLTQNEISQVMGISESRVSQIRQNACTRLQRKLLAAS